MFPTFGSFIVETMPVLYYNSLPRALFSYFIYYKPVRSLAVCMVSTEADQMELYCFVEEVPAVSKPNEVS